MKPPKNLWFVLLALVAIFLGSFAATLVAGKISSVSAASAIPAGKPEQRITKTFSVPGFTTTPCPGQFDPLWGACIFDEFPLANPPVSVDCVVNLSASDGWLESTTASCRDTQGGDINISYAVVWANGEVELLGNSPAGNPNGPGYTVTYSAVP